jgi:protein-S-isoprenylcysteine O-methyltransferase Ste14
MILHRGNTMEENQSKVKELGEKRRKGEITSEEARRELREIGLGHEETWKDFIGYVVWGILCFLPLFARETKLGFLSFFTQLSAIEFPAIVVYLSIILFIAMIPLTAWGMYFNSRKGGCRSEDHTVILLKSGPYAIVRHPSGVAWAIFFATAPIILSGVFPFTILSVVAIVGIVAYHYYECVVEERELDIPKWGKEYTQYMKEVPRFNFIKGLWNLRKRT